MRRFQQAYRKVAEAKDRRAALRRMDEVEVIAALGAAASGGDSYLANVLATEAMNRSRRKTVVIAVLASALAAFLGLRLALLLMRGDVFASPTHEALLVTSLVGFALAAVAGWIAWARATRRLRRY